MTHAVGIDRREPYVISAGCYLYERNDWHSGPLRDDRSPYQQWFALTDSGWSAEATAKEAWDLVHSKPLNAGFTFPAKRITVNLARRICPRRARRYDLPIALSILAASEQICGKTLAQYEFLDELGLSGTLRAVTGEIPTAISVGKAGPGQGGSLFCQWLISKK
ncbi:MAG: magnesium chelatase domain-containing protein [Symbiopectobacterium sp.]